MNQEATLLIEPLNKQHNRKKFQCGNAALDNYLQKQASQDLKRRISQVYVSVNPAESSSILGYYTLSTCSIALTDLPKPLARKLPKHPIPAALLGRLAVDQSVQQSGIGRLLLANAVRRVLAVSTEIGIYALLVDAIDNNAQQFYEKYGFSLLQAKGGKGDATRMALT